MDIKYIIIISIVFLLLVMVGLAIVNFSADDMLDKYRKLEKLPCGYTPIDLATAFAQMELGGRLKIKFDDRLFSDSMSSNLVLTLSSKYAHLLDFGGLVICSHELGHAIQFRDKRNKMNSHAKLSRLCKMSSIFTTPLMVAGIVLFALGYVIPAIVTLGFAVVSFFVAVVSKLSTIGIENEASKNALLILTKYANFSDDELNMAKGFLKSAKMTYIADFLKIMLKWTFLVRK